MILDPHDYNYLDIDCKLNIELKITLSNGKIIERTASSEDEATEIINYFHNEERKIQYNQIRNKYSIKEELLHYKQEIDEIVQKYKKNIKCKLKYYDYVWKGDYIFLQAKKSSSKTYTERVEIQKACFNEICNLSEKYNPIFQAHEVTYLHWGMSDMSLIEISSKNKELMKFWKGLWK